VLQIILCCSYRNREHFVKILTEFACDNNKTVYEFPSTLNSHERYLVHEVRLMQSYFGLYFKIVMCDHFVKSLNVALLYRLTGVRTTGSTAREQRRRLRTAY